MSEEEIQEKSEDEEKSDELEEEKKSVSHEDPGYMGEEEIEEREKPILIVIDDDKKTLKTVKKAFKKEFDVVDLEDAKNIIKILKEERPDLLILDEDVEGGDGWDIIAEIVDEYQYRSMWMKNIPIIMLSDNTPNLELIQRKNIERITDYITKPFEKEEIQKRVNKLIKRLEKAEEVRKNVRNRSYQVSKEYERIVKAQYIRQCIIKPIREELKNVRERGDAEEIIQYEKALNDQMAVLNFYRRRIKEIEVLAKKWKDVELPKFMQTDVIQ